jgi:hypothetical protein
MPKKNYVLSLSLPLEAIFYSQQQSRRIVVVALSLFSVVA